MFSERKLALLKSDVYFSVKPHIVCYVNKQEKNAIFTISWISPYMKEANVISQNVCPKKYYMYM